MGGTIGMTSAPQGGSTFWFTATLPATGVPALATHQNGKAVTGRVLVAEDNTVNQLVLDALLRKDGHEVVLVSDGAQALAAVQTGKFDVVLMDMQMPVMDGVEATRAIRRLPAPVGTIPIIAVTANAMTEEVLRCRSAGMNDHLAKPIDRELLRHALGFWIGQRKAAGSNA
jgi:CheY-like chemotaxis protein